MRIAAHIALILVRIAAWYVLIWAVGLIELRFRSGDVRSSFDFVFSVLFFLFWASGMFPTAKLMVRWKGTRLALGLLLATGFVIHVFRYFMPAHYLHLVGGKADLSWNIRYLWSDDNFVIALHGLVPPLVCWFEYLWMRRSPVTKPAVPNP